MPQSPAYSPGPRLYCLVLEDMLGTASLIVDHVFFSVTFFCALSEVCLLFFWSWSCGRVFWSPPASQPQTILSGAGGLRDPATLSVVFIFSRLHIVGLCLKYVSCPVFGGVVECFGLPHPSIPGPYCLELDGCEAPPRSMSSLCSVSPIFYGAVSEICPFFDFWRSGRVFRHPPAPHHETILSGAGEL